MSKQGTFLGIPYDWRWPTKVRIKERLWNDKDHRIFTPKVFGWGYSMNFYELTHHKKRILAVIVVIAVVVSAWSISYIRYLDKAHSAFANYYAFRGCTQLLEKKSDYGICKTNSGKTIKIVQYKNKWYLDGDLPCGFLCF